MVEFETRNPSDSRKPLSDSNIRLRNAVPKSPIEKLLSLFSDVRTGERKSAFLLLIDLFLLLGAYYFLKPVLEALLLAEEGAR